MQPSGSFSLVVEVQAAGGQDECGQEIQRLASCGWARLDLFDPHNQVRSGHWRAPVRSLPVRPALSPGQLNSIPQVILPCLFTKPSLNPGPRVPSALHVLDQNQNHKGIYWP